MFCWAWREVEDSSRSKDKRRGAMVHLICGSVLTYDGKLIASWFLESSLTWLDTPLVIMTIMWCDSRQLWTGQSWQLAAPRALVLVCALVLLLAGRIVICGCLKVCPCLTLLVRPNFPHAYKFYSGKDRYFLVGCIDGCVKAGAQLLFLVSNYSVYPRCFQLFFSSSEQS